MLATRGNGRWGLRPLLIATLLLASSLPLAAGCSSTSQRLSAQRLAMARAKRQGLEQTLGYLRANPNPEATSSVHTFVANEAINRSLSLIDNTTAMYQGKYLLRLERIRLASSGGFPLVSVIASASRWGLTAELSVSATALLTIDEQDPTVGTLSVHIADVVPKIQWYDLHLIITGFARDLLQSELQAQLDTALPPFEVPLLIADDIKADARAEFFRLKPDGPFWEGHIDGRITYPPVDVGGGVSIDRVLFLEDGIHCFLTLNE